jgi:hypothetical protein
MKTLALALSIFSLQLIATAKDKPLKLVELRDVPTQTVYVSANSHSQVCSNGGICLSILPVARQTFDKSNKDMKLTLGLVATSDPIFLVAPLIFSVDGVMFYDDVVFSPADSVTSGGTATMPVSDSMGHKMATAKEVWVTVNIKDRVSFKLNPRQLESITMVVGSYDAMEPVK